MNTPAVETTLLRCGVEQNLELLAQATRLLPTLTPAAYTEACGAVFKASIGQHLRHAIEHYEAVLRARSLDGVVDYEHRRRDFSVENNPVVALQRLVEISIEISEILEENVPLTVLDHGGGENPSISSLGRELQFLASHTVHHFALIGIIARLTGVTLEPGFGIAPSTLKHRQNA